MLRADQASYTFAAPSGGGSSCRREPLAVNAALLHLGAVLIGLSKVGFGGGVGAVATPVLAAAFGPREALGLTLPLLLATDLMALFLYRGRWEGRQVAALLPGTLIGIAAAAPLLRLLPPSALARVIGLLVLIFALTPRRAPGAGHSRATKQDLDRLRFPAPAPRRADGVGFLVAFVAGFTSTLAHLGGMLIAVYLLPFRLPNTTFVATASVVYCAMNATKLAPYVGAGLITRATLMQDLWLLPSLLAGVGLGFLLNRRLSGDAFTGVVRLVAVVTALKLLWQGA